MTLPAAAGPGTPLNAYKQRVKLTVSIQDALTSRDFYKLHYARHYLIRCSVRPSWGQGKLDKMIAGSGASTAVKEAIEGVDRLCDLESLLPEKSRLMSALGQAARRVNPGYRFQDPQSIPLKEIVRLGDGELMLEWYALSSARKLPRPLGELQACATRLASGLCDLAVIDAICAELACDERFRMAENCGLMSECKQATLAEQLAALAALYPALLAEAGEGKTRLPAWPDLQQAARAAVRTWLAQQGQ